MARWHLFEIEDQPWFPTTLRDSMTDYLSFVAGRGGHALSPFVAKLAPILRASGEDTLVDLCSGGGGPAVVVARGLRRVTGSDLRLVLTDLYPNEARLALARDRAAAEGIPTTVVATPVDATAVPASLPGFRLLFNAFHHLRPELAERCLRRAVDDKHGIAVLEFVDRTPFGFLQIALAVTGVFLLTPFIRPFRGSRLFFTYVVPLIPLFLFWDGFVSCLRVYSPRELRALAERAGTEGYRWEAGRLPVPWMPVRITYLIGSPLPR